MIFTCIEGTASFGQHMLVRLLQGGYRLWHFVQTEAVRTLPLAILVTVPYFKMLIKLSECVKHGSDLEITACSNPPSNTEPQDWGIDTLHPTLHIVLSHPCEVAARLSWLAPSALHLSFSHLHSHHLCALGTASFEGGAHKLHSSR